MAAANRNDDLRLRAEVCVVACAELFRDDGEVLASAFGAIPRAAVSLARLTFSPLLLQTDGEARLIAQPAVVGSREVLDVPVEGYLPFRRSFEWVWAGRRHALMGASQLDRHGNANLSVIGDWHRPKVQLIGVRGLPGNTINHTCSYWIPRQSSRTLVGRVDMVSGMGYDTGQLPDGASDAFVDIRGVVTNLGMFDFAGEQRTMRLRSIHPGVSVDEVRAATGFDLEVADDLQETRPPTDEERRLLRQVIDPNERCLAEISGS